MTQLGYQASSLKPYLTTPQDVLSTFQRLHAIGYRHAQLQWIGRAVPLDCTAEALQQAGLACIATQDGYADVLGDLDYYVRMNVLWGSKSLCVSTIPRELMNAEGLRHFAAEMLRMAAVLKDHGLGLSFHPTAPNYAPVQGVCAVDAVMEMLPAEVCLTFCVLHAVRAGVDPVQLLERYSGRVEICHFKDAVRLPDGTECLVPVGQGYIDWPPIFDACQRTGVRWGLAEQETWQKDAFVCAQESFAYIASHGITSPA